MDNRIEYGWVEPDPASGQLVVVKTEWRRRRLRVRPVEVAPAETREYRAPWQEDGREGEIVGKVFVRALVDAAEVKLGPDGRPVARPIETAKQPAVQPWERLVGPLMEIGPETITRHWTVEDRPIEDLRAERTAEIRAEMKARIEDRLLDRDDASDIREAGRAALAAIAAAENSRAVAEVAVDWPA